MFSTTPSTLMLVFLQKFSSLRTSIMATSWGCEKTTHTKEHRHTRANNHEDVSDRSHTNIQVRKSVEGCTQQRKRGGVHENRQQS